MGFPAFTLSLTTEIMDITHLRISYLIVISLKICPKYQKSPFPITIAVSANFEPQWHYYQAPHGAFLGHSAFTMSLATSLMDLSLPKRFVFRDDFLQKCQFAQFCKNTENCPFLGSGSGGNRRRRSPVECKRNLYVHRYVHSSVRPYVHPSVRPPPP